MIDPVEDLSGGGGIFKLKFIKSINKKVYSLQKMN